ncbi:hypothetical protein B296_00019265 [Ensete ventricosum]|uniref:Uncharacterized protein n=1 Tax=Ensete ventricosum TaxID=4639 RepID=A0A426XU55_ENSVE|nr:hypothetical protein B296_00019265 [Ensete ventricosum]
MLDGSLWRLGVAVEQKEGCDYDRASKINYLRYYHSHSNDLEKAGARKFLISCSRGTEENVSQAFTSVGGAVGPSCSGANRVLAFAPRVLNRKGTIPCSRSTAPPSLPLPSLLFDLPLSSSARACYSAATAQ